MHSTRTQHVALPDVGRAACLALALLLPSCASTAEPEPALPPLPFEGSIERELPASTGELLMETDGILRAWTQAKLDPGEDGRKRRALEEELRRISTARFEELVSELETGPQKNRQVAAMALGFSGREEALGPMLAALDDDWEEVRQNAMLGLGLLSDPATPLEPLLRELSGGEVGLTRNNAAFAVLRLVSDHEELRTTEDMAQTLRSALHDPEPGVRVQAATTLRLVDDGGSLEDLGDRIADDQPLVAVAALRAVGAIGERVDTSRGRAARLLYEAWRDHKGTLRTRAKIEMLRLSGGLDYGEVEADWRDWAYRMP